VNAFFPSSFFSFLYSVSNYSLQLKENNNNNNRKKNKEAGEKQKTEAQL